MSTFRKGASPMMRLSRRANKLSLRLYTGTRQIPNAKFIAPECYTTLTNHFLLLKYKVPSGSIDKKNTTPSSKKALSPSVSACLWFRRRSGDEVPIVSKRMHRFHSSKNDLSSSILAYLVRIFSKYLTIGFIAFDLVILNIYDLLSHYAFHSLDTIDVG